LILSLNWEEDSLILEQTWSRPGGIP